jgi:hypothetical protein
MKKIYFKDYKPEDWHILRKMIKDNKIESVYNNGEKYSICELEPSIYSLERPICINESVWPYVYSGKICNYYIQLESVPSENQFFLAELF